MLYIIATPIGNLGDIGARAVALFSQLDVLLCEDTRRTGMFLAALGIKNKPSLESFYDEVERQKLPLVMGWLRAGKNVGLITDSGTPVISDPGWVLVKKCRQERIPVTAVPGPSAVINALVLSGLPVGRFCFLGFLPKKVTERRKLLEKYKGLEVAKVVYESPFRLKKLLSELEEVYGTELRIAVCREMTKKFEEIIDGRVTEVIKGLATRKIRGEIVVVFI